MEVASPLPGFQVQRVVARAEITLPEPGIDAARDPRACRCCYRACWWSLKPDAALLTCGYCHPPAKHLKPTWHTDDHGAGGGA